LQRQGVLRTATVREPVSYSLDPETAAEVDRYFDVLCEAVFGGNPLHQDR
jgi:hypothetical protein